jgi:pyruvate formate lyase activating enzyme
MVFAGMEPLTLIDYPNHLAATVFTYGCNMKCPYCHNAELVTEPLNSTRIVNEKDVLSFLDNRVDKLEGLAITGGEPTMHKDLPEFMKKVRDRGFKIKLDSNGSFPKRISNILDMEIVNYWAIDVKYEEELYEQGLNGGATIGGIKESIELLQSSGVKHEFRTTVVKGMHTEGTMHKIGEMIKGAKNYYIQNFREGPTIDPELSKENSFDIKRLETFKEIMEKYVEKVEIRN